MATKPNLTLYFQLQPNVTQLAKASGLSRPTIYAIIEQSRKAVHPENIEAFNAALSALLKARIELAKKLSQSVAKL